MIINSALEIIFDGNESFHDSVKYDETYQKANTKFSSSYDKLREILNDEQKRMLDELFDNMCGVEYESQRVFFKEGFKLGARLITESFT